MFNHLKLKQFFLFLTFCLVGVILSILIYFALNKLCVFRINYALNSRGLESFDNTRTRHHIIERIEFLIPLIFGDLWVQTDQGFYVVPILFCKPLYDGAAWVD